MCVMTLWTVSFFPVCFFLLSLCLCSQHFLSVHAYMCVCACVCVSESGLGVAALMWQSEGADVSQLLCHPGILKPDVTQDPGGRPFLTSLPASVIGWFESRGGDFNWPDITNQKSKSGSQSLPTKTSDFINTTHTSVCRDLWNLFRFQRSLLTTSSVVHTSCLFTANSSTQRIHC